MATHQDFVRLVGSLAEADPGKGIRFINTRYQDSFHPYPDLFRRMNGLAARFGEEGVRKGDKVLIALDAEPDKVASFLALVWLGAIPFSVPQPLLGQERAVYQQRLEELVATHGIDHVLASKDLVGVSGAPLLNPEPCESGAVEVNAVEPVTVSPDDVAFVQFSSGSTAKPKGARITHRNLTYNIDLIVRNDRRTPRSVWVSWIPLYHDMGLVGGLFTNFVFKNDLVLMPPRCFIARPVSWLAAISKWGGTISAVPNFALDICSERITEKELEEHDIDLSSLRILYNGSEPVRVKSIRRFEDKFDKYGFARECIYPVYGMSETTLVISSPKPEEPVVTRQIDGVDVPSVGYPLGDFEISIRDDHGAPVKNGRPGEIWVRGTSVTPGYLELTGQQTGIIRDGWLATGDLGVVDESGRLYISGRKKDLIICQGRNFYGQDIAARLAELPFVRSGKVFVFGHDVNNREEVIVMTAPPNLDGASSGKGLPRDLGEFRTAIGRVVMREFGIPVYDVCIVPNVPKTTSGKVSRHRCEQLYLAVRQVPATC